MKRLKLSGEWTLKNQDYDIPARVPGDITDDLTRAGVLADPYFGYNYEDCLWVQKRSWTYEKRFNANIAKSGHKPYLVFSGVDTFSEVYLNGKLVGKTDSMFSVYEFDASQALIDGENILNVKMADVFGKMPTGEQDKYVSIFHPKRIFVRKAQCHFGWDWAPRFGGYGIYRDVYLEYRADERITDVFVTALDDGVARFKTELSARIECGITTEIYLDGELVASDTRTFFGKRIMYNIAVENAELWYPNGYGKSTVYGYRVVLRTERGTDEKEGTFGFRRVELNQRVRDSESVDFGFEINGKPVYARGSNWVPADCMTGRITVQKYEDLLSAAAEAGINMLRVWGGGVYESDEFYSLCDKYGITVWQDFMFACAEIPEDIPEFTAKIRDEAVSQVKRLRNHPCIAYWCGMNENLGAFSADTDERYSYDTTHYLLRGIVADLCGHVPYGRTSPYSFGDTENEKSEGDCHDNLSESCLLGASFKGFEHYDYALGDSAEAVEERVRNYYLFLENTESNFSSECAVLGMCSPASLRKFVPERELDLGSDFWNERFLGNPYSGVLPFFYERQRLLAKATYGESDGIFELAEKCGKVQADVMKSEIVFARGNGRSHGILTWMYNDTWPTGTWSVIDYFGDKKPAYYVMKRYFAPAFAALDRRAKGVVLTAVNDRTEDAEAKITVDACKYDGTVIGTATYETDLAAGSRREITVEEAEGADYYYARGTVGGIEVADIYEASRYRKPEYAPRYRVKTDSRTVADGYETEITISAQTYLPCVKIEGCEGAALSDDYFDMAAGTEKTVRVISPEKISPEISTFADRTRKNATPPAADKISVTAQAFTEPPSNL